MSLQYVVRPISDRSTFTGKHTYSPFSTSWSDILKLLEKETSMLSARRIVIEVDVPERGIRMDGTLRADARAASPAVRVSFESKFGPLIYATDRFRSRNRLDDWQHNVYAIALSLEALRRVDRYGISSRGEQYAGWKAIGTAPAPLNFEQALHVIAAVLNADPEEVRADMRPAVRRARALTHPDANGGDRNRWDQVDEAALALGVV